MEIQTSGRLGPARVCWPRSGYCYRARRRSLRWIETGWTGSLPYRQLLRVGWAEEKTHSIAEIPALLPERRSPPEGCRCYAGSPHALRDQAYAASPPGNDSSKLDVVSGG